MVGYGLCRDFIFVYYELLYFYDLLAALCLEDAGYKYKKYFCR